MSYTIIIIIIITRLVTIQPTRYIMLIYYAGILSLLC